PFRVWRGLGSRRGPFTGRGIGGGAALPRRVLGFYTESGGCDPMADATTAAKDRIDTALATLERKILELKARPATAPAVGDDDLARMAGLESAGRDAAEALGRAAGAVRDILGDEADRSSEAR